MNRFRSNRALAVLLCFAILSCRTALATMHCPPAMLLQAATMADDCDQGATGGDPLCQKSCNDDPQKFESGTSPALPPCLASSPLVIAPAPAVHREWPQSPLLARANAPPLIVIFGRIRE